MLLPVQLLRRADAQQSSRLLMPQASEPLHAPHTWPGKERSTHMSPLPCASARIGPDSWNACLTCCIAQAGRCSTVRCEPCRSPAHLHLLQGYLHTHTCCKVTCTLTPAARLLAHLHLLQGYRHTYTCCKVTCTLTPAARSPAHLHLLRGHLRTYTCCKVTCALSPAARSPAHLHLLQGHLLTYTCTPAGPAGRLYKYTCCEVTSALTPARSPAHLHLQQGHLYSHTCTLTPARHLCTFTCCRPCRSPVQVHLQQGHLLNYTCSKVTCTLTPTHTLAPAARSSVLSHPYTYTRTSSVYIYLLRALPSPCRSPVHLHPQPCVCLTNFVGPTKTPPSAGNQWGVSVSLI